jgi:hypothetical protein
MGRVMGPGLLIVLWIVAVPRAAPRTSMTVNNPGKPVELKNLNPHTRGPGSGRRS